MAVFRVERIKDYTVMSNHHLRNKNLSLKAKGLLSQMLSLPDDWDYTLKGLAAINKESVDAIRTAIWSWRMPGMWCVPASVMSAAVCVAAITMSMSTRKLPHPAPAAALNPCRLCWNPLHRILLYWEIPCN